MASTNTSQTLTAPHGAGSQSKPDRARGNSPPAQSKRDKKRQILNDKLSNLNDQFTRDRDRIYRDQLQKIQVDANLVMRVDPYAPRPLDIIETEDLEVVAQNDRRNSAGTRTLLEMAGPTFQEWKHNAEDLMEERDFQLTNHKYDYDRKVQEHKNTCAFKIEHAKREHKTLSGTLRDRLINLITAKKYRLSKEKEALEIADSSAFLLHPNQFSITNPSSPGANQGKRTTRLRREMDEMPAFADSKKRKRNAGDDDGSPAPTRRAVDASGTTPFWHGDRLRTSSKQNTSSYSIEKLFTDKELSMTYNAAALAAHKYILSHPVSGIGEAVGSPKDSDSSNADGNADDGDHEGSESLGAQMMERQPSHATRSTRGGQNNQNYLDDKVIGLLALANFELPGNIGKIVAQEPKLPPLIPQHYSKPYTKSAEQNTPSALVNDDITADIAVMTMFRQYESIHGPGTNLDVSNGGRRLLEEITHPPRENRFVSYLQGPRPDAGKMHDALRLPSGDEPKDEKVEKDKTTAAAAAAAAAKEAASAVPMSRQSSLGGVAMSRQGTGGSARGGRARRN